MSLLIIYNIMYEVDILSINNQAIFFSNFTVKVMNFNINVLELLSFLLISCSFIKSAQIGSHI